MEGIKLSDEGEVAAMIEVEEEAKRLNDKDRPENKKSLLSAISGILPKYFDSEWSFGRFKVPNEDNSMH